MSDENITTEPQVSTEPSEAVQQAETSSQEVQETEKPATRRGRKAKVEEPEEFVPAVRRIVLYVTAQETTRPAIITRDNGDNTFQLTVFNGSETGSVFVERSTYEPFDADLGFIAGTFH